MRLTRRSASSVREPLERSAELTALDQSLAEVTASGRGRIVLVSGEAGIGKTTLLRFFCDGLGPSVRLLWASCDPLFTQRPLGPLMDIARVTDGELWTQVDRGGKPHDVAAAVIRELAAWPPTVVVLEDVHWADEATLDVVRLVSRRVVGVPALLVASYRDDGLDRSHPLRGVLGQLAGGGATSRLSLTGLSPAAVAELARDSPVDADQLYDRTVGNPFFVTEVIAAGRDSVPDTVTDAVLARMASLSPAARALLDAVAVVPQPAEIWLLDALAGSPPGTLEECLRSGMLRADASTIAFRHELARLAVEESLAPDWRLNLHRRALAALADPPIGMPDLARLAHHAEGAADQSAVLRFARAAAVDAAAAGAHREAAGQYARTLRFAQADTQESRADLLERFADECFVTDMRDDALAALDQALAIWRDRDEPLRFGGTQRLRARLLTCAGRAVEARSAAMEAVSLLEQTLPGPELARTYAQLSEISMRADQLEEAVAWGEQAIAIAEEVGDNEALVHALSSVGTAQFARELPQGRAKVERSIELARDAGLADEAGKAYVNLVAILSRSRAWPAVDRLCETAIDYCGEHGLEAWRSYLICAKAESALARGNWSEAAEIASSILATPPDGVVGPRYGATLTLALVRARRGDPEYWPLLDEALALAQDVGELQYLQPAAVARAEAAWLEGRADAIAAETDDAFQLALQLKEPSLLGELALWRWRGGVLTAAPSDTAEVYRAQIAGQWQLVAQIRDEQGCRYEAALVLADSGDDEALRRAHDELRALGARPAAAIVTRRLRERGARGVPRGPRATTQANPAGLTARELEVLPLMVDGLRNAEIATRLVISHKTVDHHVSAILRKLDVHTRGQAVAKAGTLGLTNRT